MDASLNTFLKLAPLSLLLVTLPAFASTSDAAFGGPAETGHQIEKDEADKTPHFRYPKIDQATQSWKDWKHELYTDTGLKFGFDYTTLFQKANNTLDSAETDKAASAIARLYGKWELVNRGSSNTGSLAFKVDHRYQIGDNTTPNALGNEIGYLSQTGMLFGDTRTVLVDLNWQQYFNDGNTGIIAGKYDPNDYIDILGYANPWTAFSNLDILLNMSIALPDNSWGMGVGHWFNDSIYVLGGLNDANGTVDDNSFFEEGSEFFKYAELGWSPSQDERYLKNINITLWKMDEREEMRSGETRGIALAANWTWNQEWMVFSKLGFSDVDAANDSQLYERQFTLGFIKHFADKSDLFGMAVAYGEIPDEFNTPNDSQTTFETFYRIQIAQNFAVTPSIQYLKDPALNTEDDSVVVGLRVRLSL